MPSEASAADLSGHYPIREFARITGVNPVTLRAWERRYGIVQPQRTAKGHRFYSDQDIQRVSTILSWLEQGYPIRQVRLLLQNDQPTSQADDDWQQWRQRQIEALQQGQLQQLDALWSDGLANYPMAVYFEHCLLPVLSFLQRTPLLYQLYSQQLVQKLTALVQQQRRHNPGPGLLMVSDQSQPPLALYAMAYALGAASFRVELFSHAGLKAEHLSQLGQLLDNHQLWLQLNQPDAISHWPAAWLSTAPARRIFHNLAQRPGYLLPDGFSRQLTFFIQHQHDAAQTAAHQELHQ